MKTKDLRFVYFGGEPIGVPVLQILLDAGLIPSLVVCNPDRPSGRGQKLTAPPIKVLAESHNIPVWQPESLKDQEVAEDTLSGHDLFVVVAYNKILPGWLITLPEHMTLNLHPSLLPKLRGANPIRDAILYDLPDQVGVSVMLLDEKMDHGPLLAQQPLPFNQQEWPIPGRELDRQLAELGGQVLAETIPTWVAGTITPTEQDHTVATYTNKMQKRDGELNIDPHKLPRGEAARQAYHKICAFDGWPGTFFMHNDTRFKITKAELAPNLNGDELRILRVIPEGKSETDFATLF